MKRLFLSLYAILAVWAVKAADMPYSLELSQLYIIGDATPYAWDLLQPCHRWHRDLPRKCEWQLEHACQSSLSEAMEEAVQSLRSHRSSVGAEVVSPFLL